MAVDGRNDGGLPADIFSISMLAGGSPVGTGASATGLANTFFDLSYSFTATPAQDGQLIGIQLFASNTGGGFEQANFDNIRLSLASVPEPSSMAPLILAGASLMGSRWYRRYKAG